MCKGSAHEEVGGELGGWESRSSEMQVRPQGSREEREFGWKDPVLLCHLRKSGCQVSSGQNWPLEQAASSRNRPALVSLLCSVFGVEQPGEVRPQHNTVMGFRAVSRAVVGALRSTIPLK